MIHCAHEHHIRSYLWRLSDTAGQQCRCDAAVLTNTVFPAVCLYYFWTATEQLPMKNIMHTLMAVILAALAAKLLVEGVDTLPKYCRRRGAKALGKLLPLHLLALLCKNDLHR
jgi:hypothetical protein